MGFGGNHKEHKNHKERTANRREWTQFFLGGGPRAAEGGRGERFFARKQIEMDANFFKGGALTRQSNGVTKLPFVKVGAGPPRAGRLAEASALRPAHAGRSEEKRCSKSLCGMRQGPGCAGSSQTIFSMSHPARAGSGHGRLGDASLPLEQPHGPTRTSTDRHPVPHVRDGTGGCCGRRCAASKEPEAKSTKTFPSVRVRPCGSVLVRVGFALRFLPAARHIDAAFNR